MGDGEELYAHDDRLKIGNGSVPITQLIMDVVKFERRTAHPTISINQVNIRRGITRVYSEGVEPRVEGVGFDNS